ncbi:MAG: aminotransferase class I/II-fold pyridoxal phosphate-dependent enzyme [Candidatus Peregrinibacteria bacterium]
MSIVNLARRSVRTLSGISWGKPLPKNCLQYQFSELQEVYPPVLAALRKELSYVNRYPNIGKIARVRRLIGKRFGYVEKNVFLGNGVDALIDLVARTFCDAGDEVLIPSPTYPCYADAVRFMGATVRTMKLRPDFSLDLPAFQRAITPKTKLIFIANPNNPTGNLLLTIQQIETILKRFRGILVVDEEYGDFSDVTAASLIKRYPNLIVLRGCSKSFGIAGLRFGAAIASEQIIDLFERSQGATQVFEVNRLALAAGEAIFADRKRAERFVRAFQRRKSAFEKQLSSVPGITVLPTLTSFTLFTTPFPASTVRSRILKKNIAIKSMSMYESVPKNLLLTAVPPQKEWNRFMQTLSSSLSPALL